MGIYTERFRETYTPIRYMDLEGLTDRNATVVQVTYRSYPESYSTGITTTATGSSKREQGDVFDAELGYDLALARALQNLSRKIKAQADAKLAAYYHVEDVPEPVQEQATSGAVWAEFAPEFQGHSRRWWSRWMRS